MKHAILRTVQVGLVLLVCGALALLVLVVVGVLGREAALDIGRDVALVIGACVVAGVVLIAIIGAGRGSQS